MKSLLYAVTRIEAYMNISTYRPPSNKHLKVKVLVVDSDETSYENVQFSLRRSRFCNFEVEWLSSANNAQHALVHSLFDVYLINDHLEGDDGIELARRAKAEGCEGLIIIVNDSDEADSHVNALSAGADSCVSKDMLNTPFLERAIRHLLERTKIQKMTLNLQASTSAKVTIPTPEAPLTQQTPANHKILIVDDDAEIVDLMEDAFKIAGYSVMTTTNGLNALKLLKAGSFDVLISDMMMPGIRGDELITQASRAGVLPSQVVGITGYGTLTIPLPSKFQAVELLQKPFSMHDLVRMVQDKEKQVDA